MAIYKEIQELHVNKLLMMAHHGLDDSKLVVAQICRFSFFSTPPSWGTQGDKSKWLGTFFLMNRVSCKSGYTFETMFLSLLHVAIKVFGCLGSSCPFSYSFGFPLL